MIKKGEESFKFLALFVLFGDEIFHLYSKNNNN